MSRFQTDSLRPSALPTASLGRSRPLSRPDPSGGEDGEASTSNQTEMFYADWNTRIDKEVKAVAGGLRELVELADVRQVLTFPSTPFLAV